MDEKERYIIDRFDEDIFDTKKEYYPSNQTICDTLNQQYKRIKDLQSQLAIREKALLNIAKQLLLVYYDEGCTYGDYIVGRTDNPVETVENYIEQAKEMLENE